MKTICKKLAVFAVLLAMLFPLAAGFGCGSDDEADVTLKIHNWEDYIDEGIVEEFEEFYNEKYGKTLKVEYSTFGTNENLYNELVINPASYDLACPSDYMIQKLAHEGYIKKLDASKTADGYGKFVSPYIRGIFGDIMANGTESLNEYAACYTWGTLGLVYNAEKADAEDMKSWTCLWSEEYKNRQTIKDSVRDSFFLGVAYANKTELDAFAADFALTGNESQYREKLNELFNDTSDENIEKVRVALSELKDNIYGFEVDSGKSDVASGKIDVNFAWSGDAVYAMDQGDEAGRTLEYAVPYEGSNIWFDGWVMLKGVETGSETEKAAYEFINYLSKPEVAVRNMYYIGYTSPISGDETFEWAEEDAEPTEYGGVYDWVCEYYDLTDDVYKDHSEEVDLSYFFGNGKVVYTSELNRQFSAQYPTKDVINRCALMNYFPDEQNVKVNEMWEKIKGETFPVWAIILIVVAAALALGSIPLIRFKDKIFAGRQNGAAAKPKKAGYKVVDKKDV